MSQNRWFRIVLAFPFPLAIAVVAALISGETFRWFVFVSSELVGILVYMGFLRLLGLDPMRYSRMFGAQQEWKKEYLQPEPYRLRRAVAEIFGLLTALICSFTLFPASDHVTAAFGALLGQASYEGVRIYQGVYTERQA